MALALLLSVPFSKVDVLVAFEDLSWVVNGEVVIRAVVVVCCVV